MTLYTTYLLLAIVTLIVSTYTETAFGLNRTPLGRALLWTAAWPVVWVMLIVMAVGALLGCAYDAVVRR